MNFCSVKETAEIWGVSERFVRKLCKEGRIENAICDENTWLIPSGIEKPGRKKYERKTEEKPSIRTFQNMQNASFGRELRTITMVFMSIFN